MIVIIPHPTEELKLIELQKKLASLLTGFGWQVFKLYPLWIKFPVEGESKITLKELADSVQRIEVEEPLPLKDAHLTIDLRVKIQMGGKTFSSALPILKIEKVGEIRSLPPLEEVPIQLKIFRIGEAEFSKNSWALNGFVWKKLVPKD